MEARDKKNFTAVASLDIKKAFDSVWHNGLVYKVERVGASQDTCKMIKSFLERRTGKVKAGGEFGRPFNVGRGVPQGSRLGPQLYNIYWRFKG